MRRLRSSLLVFGLLTVAACDVPSQCERVDVPAPVRADQAPRTITVNGSGSAAAVPDVATVHIGVQSRGADPSAAVADNNATMGRILPALTALGVDAADVQTTGFSVGGQQDFDPATGQARETSTYLVDNTVSVKVREPGKLGEILGRAVAEGADFIHSVSFAVDNPQQLAREARELAVADATARAEQLALATGVTLVRVISVQESQGLYEPLPPAPAPFSGGPGSAPVVVGRVEHAAQVTIAFEIR